MLGPLRYLDWVDKALKCFVTIPQMVLVVILGISGIVLLSGAVNVPVARNAIALLGLYYLSAYFYDARMGRPARPLRRLLSQAEDFNLVALAAGISSIEQILIGIISGQEAGSALYILAGGTLVALTILVTLPSLAFTPVLMANYSMPMKKAILLSLQRFFGGGRVAFSIWGVIAIGSIGFSMAWSPLWAIMVPLVFMTTACAFDDLFPEYAQKRNPVSCENEKEQ